jgi:hypothetical protein
VLGLTVLCMGPAAGGAGEVSNTAGNPAPKLDLRYTAAVAAQAPSNTDSVLGEGLSPGKAAGESAIGLKGYVQGEVARTFGDPDHWSKMRLRGELSAQGRISEQARWKVSGRLDYDAVYDLYDFYPPDVRDDQRLNFFARENYLDFSAGNWDFRLGRQQIVWGEIVGLFFADVVSARDMREFLLPDFDILRIPQWAARAEYSADQFHAEVLWIPVPSYDKIGKPGAEFFPLSVPTPPGFATAYRGDTRPARNLSNTNYGVRLSTLQSGWDLSGFYYRSMDTQPTFVRQTLLAPVPTLSFEARHDRITQFGSTLGKDFGSVVLKAEAVYTRGRRFNVFRASDDDGVVPQKTLDWIVGLDFTLPADTRLNLQLFQRLFFEHDPDIFFKKHENGYSVYLTHDVTSTLGAEVLFISSLDRSDWMLRPKLVWKFEKNWRLTSGVDLFNGPPLGFFGRFANRDRIYSELRYSF